MKRLLQLLCIGSVALAAAPAYAATDANPVEHTIVSRGDVQIETLVQGKGPVIVILPSLGRSGEDYDEVAAKLAADGFRVLRPQPRGIGQSKGPMDGLNMHDLAADVATVIEHENAGKVVVVGHAFGNFVARELANDRPDLVRGVVVAAASAGKVPPGSSEVPIGPEIREAIDGPSNPSLPEEKRLEYLRKAFFAPGHDPRVWLDGWNPAVHKMESYAREHTPVDDYFAAGTAPILDLQAEDDPVGPRRFSKVLQSMLGDRVTIVVIPNASHALFPEQPEAVSEAIATFAHRVNASVGRNEVHAIVTGALTAPFRTIVPDFERESGNKVIIAWGPSAGTSRDAIPVRIEKGEPSDVLIMLGPALDGLIKQGKFSAATRVDIARSGIGVGVRSGAPKPDVSSPEALKSTLLAAKSIGFSEGGSGVYVSTTLFRRLGIEEQIAGKLKKVTGELVGEAIARGDVELGIQQISELRAVKGVEYVGPLPGDLQNASVISAAVSKTAKQPETAAAFVAYLSSPKAVTTFANSGLDPAKH